MNSSYITIRKKDINTNLKFSIGNSMYVVVVVHNELVGIVSWQSDYGIDDSASFWCERAEAVVGCNAAMHDITPSKKIIWSKIQQYKQQQDKNNDLYENFRSVAEKALEQFSAEDQLLFRLEEM